MNISLSDPTFTLILGMVCSFVALNFIYLFIYLIQRRKKSSNTYTQPSLQSFLIPETSIKSTPFKYWTWHLLSSRYTTLEKEWNGVKSINILKYLLEEDTKQILEFKNSIATYAICNGKRSTILKYTKANERLTFKPSRKIQDLENNAPDIKTLKNKKDLEILSKLISFVHINIAKINAISISHPTVTFAYENCGNGTIEDVLLKRRVPLNINLRLSLIKQILDGIIYISLHFGSHGSLNCRNVFIDDNWNVKIAGAGIHEFINDCVGIDDSTRVDPPIECLFIAPELIPLFPKLKNGTPKGDIYSVSMLMFMILFHELPYSEVWDRKSLLDNIANDKADLHHPVITKSEFVNDELVHLIQSCWHHDPILRPNLIRLTDRFDFLMHQEQISEFSLNKMSNAAAYYSKLDTEKYIHDLEAVLISNQTNTTNKTPSVQNDKDKDKIKQLEMQLQSEKNANLKLDETNRALETKLSRATLVPKSIEPSKLKQQNFTFATVMVVTIRHFNKISSSTDKAISLLVQYHEMIESILLNYPKIHLVEWVSDTCILVSNAPDENSLHIQQMCEFSILLRDFANSDGFKFGVPVQFRIGVQSGPVSGGVTGVPISKFILIGDTVNIAAKLGSDCIGGEIRVGDVVQNNAKERFEFEAVGKDGAFKLVRQK